VCFRYLMGVLELFDGCSEDILFVSWRYFLVFLLYIIGVLNIFYFCNGDISLVS